MVGALALAPPPALHGGQRLLGVGAGADVVLLTLPAGVQPAYSAEPVEKQEQETTQPREARAVAEVQRPLPAETKAH